MKKTIPIFRVVYDGSRFNGSQLQASVPTVQRTLEYALRGLTIEEKPRIQFSGRTDTGVHSKGQVFAVKEGLSPSTQKVASLLNDRVGPYIRITGWADADSKFGPRYSAISRTYEYIIRPGEKADPFKDAYSTPVEKTIDLSRAQKFASFFEGIHDFTNLTVKAQAQSQMERLVDEVTISEGEEGNYILTFVSRAFLRRQVRNMVNLIILGGQGELDIERLQELLKNDVKESMIRPAPAGGLYLTKIRYKEEYFEPLVRAKIAL